MLFKTVRRKDPIELNYTFFKINEIKKSLNKERGSLVGATIFYIKRRQAMLMKNLLYNT